RHNKGRNWVGWVLWNGRGLVRGVAADQSDILFRVDYEVDESTVSTVETPSADLTADCVIPLADDTTLANFAGETMAAFDSGGYRGLYEVTEDGELDGWTSEDPEAAAGFIFDVEAVPFAQNMDGGESAK